MNNKENYRIIQNKYFQIFGSPRTLLILKYEKSTKKHAYLTAFTHLVQKPIG